MQDLNKRAVNAIFHFMAVMAALIFLVAWSLRYWQAWVFLVVFTVSIAAITAYLAENDPNLLERRMKGGPQTEKEASQKLIQLFASICFIAVFVLSTLDHRFGWSAVPTYAVVAGDLLVVLGLFVVFLVFKENSFASATIEVDNDQKIVSTGPYSIVRHPMYSGSLVMLLGIPLALGSYWGLLAVCVFALVLIWRLLDEERFLAHHLSGYPEYQHKVKSRLLPFLW